MADLAASPDLTKLSKMLRVSASISKPAIRKSLSRRVRVPPPPPWMACEEKDRCEHFVVWPEPEMLDLGSFGVYRGSIGV